MRRTLRLLSLLTLSLPLALSGCPGAKNGQGVVDTTTDQPTTGGRALPPSAAAMAMGELTEEEKAEREAAEKMAADARWHKRSEALASFAKTSADALYAEGLAEEDKQNHKDAADRFTAFVVQHTADPRMADALTRAMRGRFALNGFAEGFDLVEDTLRRVDDVRVKARVHRMLGNTYLAVPHWGITRGGEFLRGQYGQGRQTQSYREDRARAIDHLEKARVLMLKHAEAPKTNTSTAQEKAAPSAPNDPPPKTVTEVAPLSDEERVETLFELVGAVARYTPYDGQWGYWWYGWAAAEGDGLENEQGEDEMPGRHYSWHQELYAAKPKGLPVTPDGQIMFAATPEAYDAALEDVSKIKYLLEEVRKTDQTSSKDPSARSLLAQALLFRARDGVERLDRLRNWWWQGNHPYKTELEDAELHTLKDDEVLGLVATHIDRFKVPPSESVPQLLTRLEEGFPKTDAADEGVWLLGQFFQSRQQYDKARAVYRRYLETRKDGSRKYQVQSALSELDRHEAAVIWSGSQPAGRNASLNLRFRNLTEVELKVRPVDEEAILRDFRRAWMDGSPDRYDGRIIQPGDLGYTLVNNYDGAADRYAKKVTQTFKRKVTPDKEGRYVDELVETPLTKPGTYLIDIYPVDKTQPLGSGLVVIEKLALINKRDTKGGLVWVVDAMTGQPVKGAKVERFEYWNDWKDNKYTRRSSLSKTSTDAKGIARSPQMNHQVLTTVRHGGATTTVGWSYYYGSYRPANGYDNATIALVMSDRPVYRPGDKVSLKVWARKKLKGEFLPAADIKGLSVTVYDAQSTQVLNTSVTADGWGSGHVEVILDDEAALGMYRVQVSADGRSAQLGGGEFRVEEYKAPEFTVKVKAAGQARLGDTLEAEVQADYLFGGGVAGGKVTYRVYREDYDHVMLAPGPWDWLYGAGYGRCYYGYGWFDWWGWYGPRPWVWYPWWGEKPKAPRELVKEGEGTLDEKGRLKIAIDTKAAKEQRGKSDHRFTVLAEVTDLSRRLIKGEGSVVVTRNAFFANIENEAGYWWARQDVRLAISTQLPDGEPLAVDGEVRGERVAYTGDTGATVATKLVETLPVKTSKLGVTRVTWRPETAGQYQFTFVAKDSWGGEVRKSIVAWVVGPEWNGRNYRFNGLEVLTDKRVYKPGETAKLLLNVNQPGASVLLATKVDSGVLIDYEIIKVRGKSTVIELPITAAHVPNFFVEATTVAEGSLFEEAREVFVPPQNAEMTVAVTADKQEYKPGEKVELKVTTADLDGKPVAADVALSVFDTSVLYIQSELTPDVRQHFWARKRTHSVVSSSSLTRTVSWGNNLSPPDRNAYWALQSAAHRYFQQEVNWQYSGANKTVKGMEDVAKTREVAKLPEAEVAGDERKRDDASGRRSAEAKEESRSELGASRDKSKKRMSRQAPAAAPAAKAVAADGIAANEEDAEAPAESQAAPSAAPQGGMAVGAGQLGAKGTGAGGGGSGATKAKPRVRRNFADTAHFAPTVRTNAQGEATLSFKLPDNLTTWKVKAIGMTADTRAGQSAETLLTTKKLLVRPQAPRFFRERDRVVLSAIVHNKYPTTKSVDVVLDVSEDLLEVVGKKRVTIKVPTDADKRVDFEVKVIGEGTARVRMDALGDIESDAKEQTFPVLVHGMTKTVSKLGSIRPGGSGDKSITLDIPADRREDLSRLELRWSPTLAGGMMDALPYLLDYPYGCTEQTLSRFVPAVLTRRALQQAGGLKLEALADPSKRNLNPQELTAGGQPDPERIKRDQVWARRSPVFDTATLNDIIKKGLKRLAEMQNNDGGWGWWGRDGSSRYTTTHVVAGLLDAQDADLAFDRSMLNRGKSALSSLVQQSLWRYEQHEWVGNDDAYAAWVMSRYNQKNDKLLGYLWERREKLSAYGKILAAMAFHQVDDEKKAEVLLRNAEQILEKDDENETTWLETRKEGGGWWYWYNDAIETNAIYLRALDTMKPGSDAAPRVVKWLLNHRKNGYYWRSTRDTAAVIAAFANHMQKSGERRPDYDLEILLDGKVLKTVHIDKTNLFTFDNSLILEGKDLTSGEHELTFRRKGEGAVYFNSYLSYFTTEEDVEKAGLEIKVERNYYKLVRRDRERKVQGDDGRTLTVKEVAYARVPLASGAQVQSGDLLLVELMLESKNDYTFLAFEDPKPAGAEPVALKSGATYGEAVANMELRDEKVAFFLRNLTRGKLRLSYRLRAEIPGEFHAMPTIGYGMYAPELKANSDEMRLIINDAP